MQQRMPRPARRAGHARYSADHGLNADFARGESVPNFADKVKEALPAEVPEISTRNNEVVLP